MLIVEKLQSLTEDVEILGKSISSLEGKRSLILEQLKTDFDIDDLKAAYKEIDKLEGSIAVNKERISTDLKKAEEILDGHI